MNHVILIGRLTKDPEIRYTPNGNPVSNFTLAVDRPFTDQAGERQADFIPIVVWGKSAEASANYLRKGRMVAIEGRIQVRTYETKEGDRRWVTEVIAGHVKFLERGQSTKQEPEDNEVDLSEINLDDLPF
jgi:single-strand DNA-binding protein